MLPQRGRRQALTLGAAMLAGMPAWAAARPARLAAAWRDAEGYHVGRLDVQGAQLRIAASLEVPTRAHGLLREPGGTLLAVARRPGDWLLRWSPEGRRLQEVWIEPERAFTGHLALSADGRRLFCGESDLDSGAGLIGVRDAISLEKLDEWPSHGVDVHEMLPRGDSLWVANGGIATRPETGRLKLDLAAMDSSLVRLDAGSGEARGQWRVEEDSRLSLRHLAWRPDGKLGIAIQAEHEEAAAKAAAPILAVFDGQRLRLASQQPTMAGYGGDIAATAEGFMIGCPRSGGLARFSADGQWLGFTALPEACALAEGGQGVWAGGRGRVLHLLAGKARAQGLPALELDNHWILL